MHGEIGANFLPWPSALPYVQTRGNAGLNLGFFASLEWVRAALTTVP